MFLCSYMHVEAQVTFEINVNNHFKEPIAATLFLDSLEFDVPAGSPTQVTLPAGRYRAVVLASGYEPWLDTDFLVRNPMENLVVTLQEQPRILEEVEVRSRNLQSPVEELKQEKLFRIAASYDDPVRTLAQLPGAFVADDQANHITVFGIAPTMTGFTLNGTPVASLSHLSSAGTLNDDLAFSGGGVLALSSQVIESASLQFENQSFENQTFRPVQLNLQTKSIRQKPTLSVQAGVIGVEAKGEGRFGENKEHGLLVNARYSTFGLLSNIVDLDGEEISFSDFFANYQRQFDDDSQLSVWALIGGSTNDKDTIEMMEAATTLKETQDILSESDNILAGAHFQKAFNDKLIWNTRASFSQIDQRQVVNFHAHGDMLRQQILFAQTSLDMKISPKMQWQFGLRTWLSDYELNLAVDESFLEVIPVERAALSSAYFEVTNWFSDRLRQRAGVALHLGNKLLPGGIYQLDYFLSKGNISLTFSTQPVENLRLQPTDTLAEQTNISLQYQTGIGKNTSIRLAAFFNRMDNLPLYLDRFGASVAATDVIGVGRLLANRATVPARQYGFSMNYNWQFLESGFLQANAAVFKAETEINSIERSRFASDYTVHLAVGNEWQRPRKWGNRIIGVSLGLQARGGYWQPEIDRLASADAQRTVYSSNVPTQQLDPYFRLDGRFYIKKLKGGMNSTWSLDIQNLLNIQNVGYLYYEPLQDAILTRYQLGIIPVLSYRVEFSLK